MFFIRFPGCCAFTRSGSSIEHLARWLLGFLYPTRFQRYCRHSCVHSTGGHSTGADSAPAALLYLCNRCHSFQSVSLGFLLSSAERVPSICPTSSQACATGSQGLAGTQETTFRRWWLVPRWENPLLFWWKDCSMRVSGNSCWSCGSLLLWKLLLVELGRHFSRIFLQIGNTWHVVLVHFNLLAAWT